MRPDASDPACQRREWDDCRLRDDVWKNVDIVLNESGTFPKDQRWQLTFEANGRSERDAKHGKRVVALITTFTLGGPQHQTRADVFYEWSRVKLFDLAVAVNTGDGGCPTGGSRSGVCNRYGTYPDLVDIQFGKPTGAAPDRSSCLGGSSIRCVWTRDYADGVNVLNASPERRASVKVSVPGAQCRHVYDVYARRALADNHCVRTVNLDMPAWSGRPLLLSSRSFR